MAYMFQHMSNAYAAVENPGVDSHMITVSYTFAFRFRIRERNRSSNWRCYLLDMNISAPGITCMTRARAILIILFESSYGLTDHIKLQNGCARSLSLSQTIELGPAIFLDYNGEQMVNLRIRSRAEK